MGVKIFKMRSLTVANGKTDFVDVTLEIEGERAFVVWDSITVGGFNLKARVEIDPGLLQKSGRRGCDYFYHGQLVLPNPQLN